MSDRIEKYGLNVDAKLVNFIESEAIPGTGVDVQKFWQGFAEIIEKFKKYKTYAKKVSKIQNLKEKKYSFVFVDLFLNVMFIFVVLLHFHMISTSPDRPTQE